MILKDQVVRRKSYPFPVKIAAVKAVRRGKIANQVATEFGIPVQTLSNWVKADRGGELQSKLPFSVVEMEIMLDFCEISLSCGSTLDDAPERASIVRNLQKKISSKLKASRNKKSDKSA